MNTLSIIIPVYNVEEYLPACLESVERAARGRCEILLVDDGSTDSSGVLCDSYACEREGVRVIHQQNAGLGGARNTGIEAATGEYLMFVDSDDTVTEDSVDTVLEYIDRFKPDILRFRLRSVDSDTGRVLYEYAEAPYPDTLLCPKRDKYLLTISQSACDKVVRASLFRESGIRFPSKVWYEDLRTVPKLLAICESAVFCNKELYNYLCRDGSIMNNARAERNAEITEATDDLRAWFCENGLFAEFAEEIEYLTVSNVLLDTCARLIRQVGAGYPLIKDLRGYALEKCPDMDKNKYCRQMSGKRKLLYRLLKAGMMRTVGFLLKIKK